MISPCGRGEPETTSACGGPAGSSRSSNACTSLMRSIVRLEIYGISVIRCYFNRLCEMRARVRRRPAQDEGQRKAAASARRGQAQDGGKPRLYTPRCRQDGGKGKTGARAGRGQGQDGGKPRLYTPRCRDGACPRLT